MLTFLPLNTNEAEVRLPGETASYSKPATEGVELEPGMTLQHPLYSTIFALPLLHLENQNPS